ncbi:shikimate dehydrogenase [Microbacterium halophytorum]|uniref:shikimate dehydrogenase n=1 Tax=Microbacterium halophytorum TaxID=2067568 RepID=UPI001E326E2D|nr:shikimate dehydrogenase [Microbacterium halophytorum]
MSALVHSTAPLLPGAPRTVLLGLIGHGVRPSLTPRLHELEGARHGIGCVYRPIEIASDAVDLDELGRVLGAARALGFDGLNVTHPAKQAIIPLLDGLAPSAERIGAVNTVQFTPDGLVGHNTDVTGFGAAFDQAFGAGPHGRVVQFGAGGAGYAVAAALAERDVAELVIVDPVLERATALAERLGGSVGGVRAAEPDEAGLLDDAEGAVNATPFGMAGLPGKAFDPDRLPMGAWVADIVYRPTETALLAAARRRGLGTMNGLGMAAGQAIDAFEIFTGLTADRAAMIRDIDALAAAEAVGGQRNTTEERNSNHER